MGMHGGSLDESYSFLHVAGRVVSNADELIDNSDQRFSYHCKGELLLCPAMIEVHPDVAEDGVMTVRFPVDMEVL